jgi:Protein of unknown function (DUF3579)
MQQDMGTMPGLEAMVAGLLPEQRPHRPSGVAELALGTSLFLPERVQPVAMKPSKPRQYVIQGRTLGGEVFRPSDWAERLAGAMSSFRPGGGGGIGAYIGYSPYCVPQLQEGVKCVQVNEALRGIEPMAWDFVMNFARDNQLQVVEVDPLPAPAPEQRKA